MKQDMPRKLPKYVHRERTRHGRIVTYFQMPKGPRVRLPDDTTSDEFAKAYNAAKQGNKPEFRPNGPVSGTLHWLVERYKESQDFLGLALATRIYRDAALRAICKRSGHVPYASITSKVIRNSRDARKSVHSARNFLKAMSALFSWAVEAEYVLVNPCRDVKRPTAKTTGYHTWTVEELASYEARWPYGTRERLAMEIMLCTGMRRTDCHLFGRQHVKGDWVSFVASKNAYSVEMPLLPNLKRAIEAMPVTDLTYLMTEHGRPFKSAASFGNWFAKACRAVPVKGRCHGLRKVMAVRLAENGATNEMIDSVLGWYDPGQSKTYTKNANRKKLAIMGTALLIDKTGT